MRIKRYSKSSIALIIYKSNTKNKKKNEAIITFLFYFFDNPERNMQLQDKRNKKDIRKKLLEASQFP